MTTREKAASLPTKRRGIGLGLLLTLVALGGYLLRHQGDETAKVERAAAEHENPRTTAAPPARARLATQTAKPSAEANPDEAHQHHEDHDTHRPSHPLDMQRQRIYRENNFQAALMSAMNQSDVPGLRALVAEYRSAYPEDEFGLQDGYTLVANCLDQLTTERQEEARDYWRTHRSSTVRRFIRRHCLERSVSAG